jgi:hypothetical protein
MVGGTAVVLVEFVKVFLTRDKMDVMVYNACSFSSSSAKGLKEVKLATSSSLVLLRERIDCPLKDPMSGVETDMDSVGWFMWEIHGERVSMTRPTWGIGTCSQRANLACSPLPQPFEILNHG